MTRGNQATVVMLVLLALAAAPFRGEDADADVGPGELADELLADDRYQRDLPHWGCPNCPYPWERRTGSGGESTEHSLPEGGERTARDGRPSGGPETDSSGDSLESGSAEFMRVLRFFVMGAGVICVCVFLARHLRGRRPDVPLPAPPGPEPLAPTRIAPMPSGEPLEALVAAGCYDEAVHVLLLRTLKALGRGQYLDWPDCWTAREYSDALELDASGFAALRMLIGTVERNLFGGVLVDREDWERCANVATSLGVEVPDPVA